MHLVTWPYNFDGLTGPSVKDCLSAAYLIPCRFKQGSMQLRVMPIINISYWCLFWRNQYVADGTVCRPLYEEPTLSISNADFRLYEFLKNNSLRCKP